jgi:hypothetical protein
MRALKDANMTWSSAALSERLISFLAPNHNVAAAQMGSMWDIHCNFVEIVMPTAKTTSVDLGLLLKNLGKKSQPGLLTNPQISPLKYSGGLL